ncbi:hypothetical protein TNCV_3803841 [Trichonephila clavipes]|nr:hypothetical protein TNCV_3803841 [Trichonephila clavipes]
MLGRRIAARPRPPATVRDLEIALLEEWNSIPQSLIDNLIASMANSLSFEDHADDSTILHGCPSILKNTLKMVMGLPPLLPFHQPHERTCGSTAI